MISPSDIAATLAYLIPGFISIKVFSFFALKASASDLELTVWSLLASVPLAWAGLQVSPGYGVLAAILVGVAAAGLAAFVWNRDLVGPLRQLTAPTARAAILQKAWIQVMTSNGEVLSGRLRLAAETAAADQDLYIDKPAWIVKGQAVEMPETAGVLIPGSSIVYIQLLGKEQEGA